MLLLLLQGLEAKEMSQSGNACQALMLRPLKITVCVKSEIEIPFGYQ